MKTIFHFFRRLWSQIWWRLFVSHLLVAVTTIAILSIALLVLATGFSVNGIGPQTWGWGHVVPQEVRGEIRQALSRALFVAGAAGLIAAMATSAFVSRRILEPLRALLSATRRIADGHYGERVPVIDNFEITDLAVSFNQMASTLEQTEQRRQTLMADVSHELRTPLTNIKGYLEGLMDGVVPWDPETFSLLHLEASRLERLVQDLQELSRLEAGQTPLTMSDFPLDSFVAAILDEQRAAFERKNIDVICDCPVTSVWVHADRDRCKQIMLNLLSNALRYTPARGRVTVALRQDSQGVDVSVSDTGMGIAPADLSHIFTRFYRVDKSRSRSGGGTGIGLTIARHLAQAHGGDITVASTRGVGTTFTVHLPASIMRLPGYARPALVSAGETA